MKTIRRTGLAIAASYAALVGVQGLATAKGLWVKQSKDLGFPAQNCQYCHTDQMQKKVKDMGMPAQNCMYCHTEKMPKKDTFKPDQLNDRGKWLMAEKDKRKAEIDLNWLKDYPGGKDQK